MGRSTSQLSQIGALLSDYTTEVERETLRVAQKCAKNCAKEIGEASSKFEYHGRTKVPYADSWKYEKDESGGYTVYSEVPGLPHLLENGHSLIVHGEYHGHVPGIKHIGPAAKKAVDEYIEQVEKVVSG